MVLKPVFVTKDGFFCFNSMKVVNPIDTEHLIALVPRYYTDSTLTLSLYNEFTKLETVVPTISILQNGILTLTFDFIFAEDDKYQVKIDGENGIVYRGKLIATTQSTQNYKLSNDLYFYE